MHCTLYMYIGRCLTETLQLILELWARDITMARHCGISMGGGGPDYGTGSLWGHGHTVFDSLYSE